MLFPVLVALVLLATASAHVTLNPNYGAGAGGYYKTSLKIPHGSHMKETTKITVDIPNGILSAVPEALHGWDVTVTTRAINPYISHGNTVNTAPASVTWTATCTGAGAPDTCDNADHAGLDNGHLLELEMQIKLGCDFGVDMAGDATPDATVWMDQHTLWFTTSQWVSTPGSNDGNDESDGNKLSWTGIVEGTESWSAAQPKPSPYVFIYSTGTCTQDSSTGDAAAPQIGMRWGANAEVVPPADNQEAVKSKEEVRSASEASVRISYVEMRERSEHIVLASEPRERHAQTTRVRETLEHISFICNLFSLAKPL